MRARSLASGSASTTSAPSFFGDLDLAMILYIKARVICGYKIEDIALGPFGLFRNIIFLLIRQGRFHLHQENQVKDVFIFLNDLFPIFFTVSPR